MLRKLIILCLLLLLLVVAIGAGSFWIYNNTLRMPLPLTKEWHYTLPPKTNLSQVAIDLMEQGLLDYPSAFVWVTMARWEQKAHLIKAGEYVIPIGTTPLKLLDILIEGKSIQHTLTLPEGWNFRQVMAAIRNEPHLTHTLDNLDDAAIMKKLGLPDQHPEGRFYPDTYLFPAGMTDVAFLQRAYRTMDTTLHTVWEKRQPNLPLNSAYEALTLASIVEKETAVAEERPRIAGVFIRRLQKNMKLETDPTVIYALGTAFDGNIHARDLLVDSPYNTYKNKGLPPTPIAMPGREALLAALNPEPGEALYFVAKGDGSHYFSASIAEHDCAVIEYQLKGKAPERYKNYCAKYPSCAACRSST